MEYLFVYAGVMPSKNTTRNENRQILFEISKRLLIVASSDIRCLPLRIGQRRAERDDKADDDNKPLIAAVLMG